MLLLQCILVMPHGKFASTNYQKHHLDFRRFTVPYFSLKPSRSSTVHYGWPSLFSYELMDRHQGLFIYIRWREMSQARLGTYETKIVPCDAKHSISTVSQKNRVLWTVYLDLGSVGSSVWNFWTSFLDFTSWGKQWWHFAKCWLFSQATCTCAEKN